jgi:hypothetical protein
MGRKYVYRDGYNMATIMISDYENEGHHDADRQARPRLPARGFLILAPGESGSGQAGPRWCSGGPSNRSRCGTRGRRRKLRRPTC